MKILIADDSAYNRSILEYIINDLGHDSIQVENGKEAVDQVAWDADADIDLVLMDVMMPVMDGLEATRKIKKEFPDRFLPVLFVTSQGDDSKIAECLESGGDDFISKPVSETVLVAKLRAHARTKTLYDSLSDANTKLTYHRNLVEREHSIVEHIFKNAGDRVKTTCDNIDVYTSPMSMFNGDLILSSPSPSGGAYCLVGDFTGHGLAASIGSLPLTEVFFQHVAKQASVAQMARKINKRLKALLPSNMFFCGAIVEVDSSGEMITLWLGGMNDVLCFNDRTKTLTRVESDHMALGILSDEEFDDSPKMLPVPIGTRLYIYTDGLIEANNANDTLFGQYRLEGIIAKYSRNVIAAIISNLNQFSGGQKQSDDVSIIEIRSGKIHHRKKGSGELVDVMGTSRQAESVPWRLRIELVGDDLRNASVVDQMMSFVSSIQGIELHQDKLFTIVSELYSNALEHGVLGLESELKSDAEGFEKYYTLRDERLKALKEAFISIKFEYLRGNPNQLYICITDSGAGFDIESIFKKSQSRESMTHGRGINLLNYLCSRLDYSNGGRTVVAIYDLCQH